MFTKFQITNAPHYVPSLPSDMTGLRGQTVADVGKPPPAQRTFVPDTVLEVATI